ncbi:MAG: histidine kinase [Deltaproteobacteria bacterium]|nr:histidine kinase [Deltaproteobacteria bacterium]
MTSPPPPPGPTTRASAVQESLTRPRAVDGTVLDKRVAMVDLIDADSFRDLLSSFSDLYRVGIKVFDDAGNRMVDVRVGNSALCGYLWEFGGTRQACTKLVTGLKNDAFAARDGLPQPHIVDCFTGLRYVVVPLVYEGDAMGRLILGPYLPADRPGLAEQLYSIDSRVERQRAELLLERVRRAPEDVIGKVLTQLGRVIDVVLHTSMRQLLTSQLHIMSVTTSYHELEERARQLREQNEKLQELDKMKSNFLATVSHELRTPLTSVIGYSEMLLEGIAGNLVGEQRDFVQTIKEKGASLLALITQLLDASRAESGNLSLQIVEFDPTPVLAGATTSIVPQCAKKKIELTVDLAPGLPVLKGDRDKVGNIVVNLLGNAMKFTPQGGRITLSAQRWSGPRPPRGNDCQALFGVPAEDFVRIVVQDTGIGIPADKVGRVFERFYQVDDSSTREFGGTGLGLAIVKSFVDAHRGEVFVESVVGEGSRFTVLLPV